MIHNLIGITGRFGSGKTLYAVEWGLKLANYFEKNLVVNFPLNIKAVKQYCRIKGYKWFLSCGRIIQIDVYDSLMNLWHLSYGLNQHSITIFDEGGVMANSRSWSSVPKDFFKYLFQLRKLDVHLLVVFQFEEQVDKQIRLAFQRWIVCKASGYYDKSLKKPRILQRIIYHYDPEKFFRLQENSQARGNPVLPWLWSEKVDFSFAWIDYILYFFSDLVHALLASFGMRFSKPVSPLSVLFRCFDSGSVLGGANRVARRPSKLFALHDFELWVAGGRSRLPVVSNGHVPNAVVFHRRS